MPNPRGRPAVVKLYFPSPDIRLEIIDLWKQGFDTYEIAGKLFHHKVTEGLAYDIVTDYVELKHRGNAKQAR
jgi:hypothetical protein